MRGNVWGTENRERGRGHFPGGVFNQRARLADARFPDFCGLPGYVALKAQLLLPHVSSAIERHISDSTIVEPRHKFSRQPRRIDYVSSDFQSPLHHPTASDWPAGRVKIGLA